MCRLLLIFYGVALEIPVLVSIRDEDYNVTPLNGKAIKYDVVELSLSKEEAEDIYNIFTQKTGTIVNPIVPVL